MALLFRNEFKSFDDDSIKKLTVFDELKLNEKVTLKNRLVMAPMTTCASNDDLTVADDEADYYAVRSTGVAMVITGCTFFQPNGQGFKNQFYAGSDEFIPSLKKLADAIKGQGAKAVLQIFHAGREGIHEDLVAPSAVKSPKGPLDGSEARVPRELKAEEITEIINGFYETTKRAIEAGFDGVEIHGANGYLIQQFFSGASNLRTDEWGGSLENRIKFPLAVIEAVNKAKKEFADDSFIVGYRFSPEEEGENGITLADSEFLVDKLSDTELDYLHLSTAHYRATQKRDNSDRRYIGSVMIEKINGRKPLIGVGEVMTKVDANNALEKVGYSLLALGHSIVADPDWVEKVQRDEQTDMFIHPNDLAEQHIPVKMAEMIKSVKNWFYFM